MFWQLQGLVSLGIFWLFSENNTSGKMKRKQTNPPYCNILQHSQICGLSTQGIHTIVSLLFMGFSWRTFSGRTTGDRFGGFQDTSLYLGTESTVSAWSSVSHFTKPGCPLGDRKVMLCCAAKGGPPQRTTRNFHENEPKVCWHFQN